MVCNFGTEVFSGEPLRMVSAPRRTLILRRLGLVTKPAFSVTSGPSRVGLPANPLEIPPVVKENDVEVYDVFDLETIDLFGTISVTQRNGPKNKNWEPGAQLIVL